MKTLREGKTYSIIRALILALSIGGSFVFSSSCTDPGLLNADQNFSKSGLQTIFVDTFSVITSTVLIDSIPTANTSNILLGSYKDDFLGTINSSTYFQIGYFSNFLPDATSIYDSIGLILHYNKYSYGDTTKLLTLNFHELTQTIKQRFVPPYVSRDKISALDPVSSIYNTSSTPFNSTPITSATLDYHPHRDSIYVRFPGALGKKWFDIARADTSSHFKDVVFFINNYFRGIHIETPVGTDASIAGFNVSKAKLKIYYRRLNGDALVNTSFTFPLVNAFNQFNKISADRSTTVVPLLKDYVQAPSTQTGNISFVQSGIGIYTKIEFPTLKSVLKNKTNVILDAVLEVQLVQNSNSSFTAPPAALSLYGTDESNILLGGISSGSGTITGGIIYDKEYNLSNRYLFSLTNYINGQIKTDAPIIPPIALISNRISTEVNRLVIGNRFHPTNKIKLKIYYSQYGTNQ